MAIFFLSPHPPFLFSSTMNNSEEFVVMEAGTRQQQTCIIASKMAIVALFPCISEKRARAKYVFNQDVLCTLKHQCSVQCVPYMFKRLLVYKCCTLSCSKKIV